MITQIFKKDFIVGLDIGTSSVKIAQFRRQEDGLHLVKTDLREIGGENKIVPVLKDLFRGINVKKLKVIASINCPKTALKVVKTPFMPKSELRDGIGLQAKNYFPFPIEDAILDYEISGDNSEKGVREYEVAVSVSPKATIAEYLAILGKAGIKPASFVSCPYALQKLTERSYAGKNQTICIIDMGILYTELVIFSAKGEPASGRKGLTLMLSRKIPVGGMDITEAMTTVLGSDLGKTALSPHEAEKIKREVGIPPEGESKIIDNKISTVQILSMLRPSLEQLMNEIGRCFDYYREEAGGGKIDSLVLFGGGAALGGLAKYLSEGLGLEVRLGDAFEGLKVKPEGIQERSKLACRLDLAIGAALTEGKGINLLPAEIKEEKKRVIKRGTLTAILTAILLASLLLFIGLKIQLNNLEKRIAVAKMELRSLQPQRENAETHYLASMVLADEPNWEDVFKELSNLMPDNIHLTKISRASDMITMQGVAVSKDNNAEQLVSGFIVILEKGIFNKVELIKINDLTDHSGSEYELKCRVD